MSDHASPETPETSVDVAAMTARVAQLEKQNSDYKFLVADLENSRKRLSQDADRQRRYASESFARDMLAVIDNLDRALEAAQNAGASDVMARGITATMGIFLDTFKRHGVHRIDCGPGSVFDPNFHMAVQEFPTNDVEPGNVYQVLQQGFMLHDRVLRPASVVVASAPPAGS